MKANQSIKELLRREYLHDREKGALSALLAGEQAAVDTYNLAIARVKDRELIPILENCRDSHAIRIGMLRQRMEELGDKAPQSAGWLGTVAGILEGGASIIGDRVAMSVLAAGEEFGSEQCAEQMKNLDSGTYELVEEGIVPAQKKTLETMTILCSWLKSEHIEEERKSERSVIDSLESAHPFENPDSVEMHNSADKQAIHANGSAPAALSMNEQQVVATRKRRHRVRTEIYNPFWFG